ncbi:hypothetical protein ACIBI4_28245 [Streptomyces sp. NPDC050418]|uniref:hypothetical protein n=1 Tax=Streptomyces sp. NPDC050418 TaxID=3365612 RepID=UPI0037BB6D60
MGSWAVVAQYAYGDAYQTDFVRRGLESKEQALDELRSLVATYLPTANIMEKWRRVYRYDDQVSYLVEIKGKITTWQCTLRIVERVEVTEL